MGKTTTEAASLMIVAILIVGLLFGCSARNTGENTSTISTMPDEMNKETELLIKQAALNWLLENDSWVYDKITIDDIVVKRYYGTYNGAVVVVLGDPFITNLAVETPVWVCDMEFRFNTMWIFICKDGSLYAFKEALPKAYTDGVLTKDDIQVIHDKYKRSPPLINQMRY